MRLTWSDLVATLLIGSAVALYAAFLAGAQLPLVSGPRVLAVVVLGLAVAACAIGAELPAATEERPPDAWIGVLAVLGTVAFIAAIIAMITGNAVFLATVVCTVTLMWLLSTARHALARPVQPRVTDADLRTLTEREQPARPSA